MILVDTSVWIDFLKGSQSKHHYVLHRLIEDEEDICLTGIILAEILQGIRSDRAFRKTKKYLLEFPLLLPKDQTTFIRAAQIFRSCKKSGLTIRRSVDCLIASIAIENNLTLLHNDKDFERIAKVSSELQTLEV